MFLHVERMGGDVMSEKYRRMLCRQEGERLQGVVASQGKLRVSTDGAKAEDLDALAVKIGVVEKAIVATDKTVAELSAKVGVK